MSLNPFLEKHRIKTRMFASTFHDGFNGAFEFQINGENVRVLASDGLGWQHVSVSKPGQTRVPNWDIMCQIKTLFWGEDVWVCQFHPAKSEYVNNHPGCLHLWRPTDQSLPVPDTILVGMKDKNPKEFSEIPETEKMKHYLTHNLIK